MLDMGLGPIHGNYQVVSDEEYDLMKLEAEEVQLQGAQAVEISDGESDDEAGMEHGGVEKQMVVTGVGLQGMGQRG